MGPKWNRRAGVFRSRLVRCGIAVSGKAGVERRGRNGMTCRVSGGTRVADVDRLCVRRRMDGNGLVGGEWQGRRGPVPRGAARQGRAWNVEAGN